MARWFSVASTDSRSRPKRGWLLFPLLLLPLSLLLCAALVQQYLQRPLSTLPNEQTLTIAAGTPLTTLSRELRQRGIIEFPLAFEWLARLRGAEHAIQRGEYLLPAHASPAELLTMFVTGDTRQYRLTIVEGWTFAQALAEIHAAPGITKELSDLSPEAVAQALELNVSSPEGMIFPDTYYYPAGDSDLRILRRANAKLRETLEREWKARAVAAPWETPYEALILASIVEKEAANNWQRGLIAGVFARRLQLDMRLQSDPTVIYGIGAEFDGDLRATDLARTTPYNTYRVNGLPPTPIALAGLSSIRAAMRPTPSDYLYFVATNDGGHYFSATLDEHNVAVDCYQRRRQTIDCPKPSNPLSR